MWGVSQSEVARGWWPKGVQRQPKRRHFKLVKLSVRLRDALKQRGGRQSALSELLISRLTRHRSWRGDSVPHPRRGQPIVVQRVVCKDGHGHASAMPSLLCKLGRRLVRIDFMAHDTSHNDKIRFGKALRKARLAKTPIMTQTDLYKLTGYAQDQISKLENGDRRANPTFDTMHALAKAVGKSMYEMLKPEHETSHNLESKPKSKPKTESE